MRIAYTYHGKETVREIDRKEIMIGRLSPLSAPDIDLGDDPTVSRKHSRIKLSGEEIWIEDLRSTNGTVVDGDWVESALISPASSIRLGETVLQFGTPEAAAEEAVPAATPKPVIPTNPPSPKPSAVLPPRSVLPPKGSSSPAIDPRPLGSPPAKAVGQSSPPGSPKAPTPAPSESIASKPVEPKSAKAVEPAVAKAVPSASLPKPGEAPKAPGKISPKGATPEKLTPGTEALSPAPAGDKKEIEPLKSVSDSDSVFRNNLAHLFEVPLSFTPEMRLDDMLAQILERVLKLIPGAKRGAILLTDPGSDKLVLRASVPAGEIVVSESLARRVMEEGHGFILERNVEGGSSLNPKLVKVETGMYAPLVVKERALGAVYVDDPERSTPYSEDDMQFLLATSHYLATVVYNQELQSGLIHNSTMLNRVSAKFPPSVQEKLMEAIRTEKLKPNGQKSDLPILFADLRGFQSAGNEMPVATATEMIGEYFSVIQKAIFKCDGTIDRFSGDNIAAVFGAPEEDEKHAEKSVVAAITMRDAVKELNVRRVQSGGTIWHLGVGVSLGPIFHGFVGTREHMEFAVTGPGVYRAKGFCKGAQNGEVLIGPELYQKVFKLIEADRSTVESKEFGEFHCYRVKGLKQH